MTRLFRRWLQRRHKGYLAIVPREDEHLRLERAFVECPGEWVAIDRRTGEVRLASASPYDLAARIKSERIRGVDILRAPAVDEPEVVGFG